MRSATCAGPACPRDAPLRQEPVYICMEKTKNAHAEEKKAERQRAQTVLSTLVTNLEQHYILSQRHPKRLPCSGTLSALYLSAATPMY